MLHGTHLVRVSIPFVKKLKIHDFFGVSLVREEYLKKGREITKDASLRFFRFHSQRCPEGLCSIYTQPIYPSFLNVFLLTLSLEQILNLPKIVRFLLLKNNQELVNSLKYTCTILLWYYCSWSVMNKWKVCHYMKSFSDYSILITNITTWSIYRSVCCANYPCFC